MKLPISPRIAFLLGSITLLGAAHAQVTTRASLATDGSELVGQSQEPSITPDARFVAFAKVIYHSDVHQESDVFVRNRMLGTTVRVSEAMAGGPGNHRSRTPSISADGRYVAFWSFATDLVPGDTNASSDIFVRDLATGGIERASLGPGGAQADAQSDAPSISADGRFVAFSSLASNLVAGDTNNETDIFVRDRLAGTTERVSLSSTGLQADGWSSSPTISPDARWVVFSGRASNLVPGDTNGEQDAFVRDRLLGTTERISVATGGAQATGGGSSATSISADGRFVAFLSWATNLARADTNGAGDAFVRDRTSQTTELVSVSMGGVPASLGGSWSRISADGRFVAFSSWSPDLVPGDSNGYDDVFVRDRLAGTCERVSVDPQGLDGNGGSYLGGFSPDGRFVAFWGWASNLVSGDTNGSGDVFLRDRDAAGFDSLCAAGTGNVMPCPCSNPPEAPGKGCDNSAGTGGATLSAHGIAYVSTDSLVFQTSGEKPTALSIVLQGNQRVASGIVYGQGVRCLDGTLKRLYSKVASGGSITAPDLGAGDLPVSARSAALGDPLQPGASRYYLVYYRDPAVLGGCPAASTFNATQTGRVTWW